VGSEVGGHSSETLVTILSACCLHAHSREVPVQKLLQETSLYLTNGLNGLIILIPVDAYI
jgi:hypothetical protein